MPNWKTTIGGVIAAIAMILRALKIDIPQPVEDGLVAIGIFIMGFFAKDKNVTGGTTPQ